MQGGHGGIGALLSYALIRKMTFSQPQVRPGLLTRLLLLSSSIIKLSTYVTNTFFCRKCFSFLLPLKILLLQKTVRLTFSTISQQKRAYHWPQDKGLNGPRFKLNDLFSPHWSVNWDESPLSWLGMRPQNGECSVHIFSTFFFVFVPGQNVTSVLVWAPPSLVRTCKQKAGSGFFRQSQSQAEELDHCFCLGLEVWINPLPNSVACQREQPRIVPQ